MLDSVRSGLLEKLPGKLGGPLQAGLHLGTTTIGRIRKENPAPRSPQREATTAKSRTVTAKSPNHVWQIDLTVVPTPLGFWCSWSPFAWPQCWPFCWWLAVVLDHYSRRVMGYAIVHKAPTSVAVRACLGRAISAAGTAPRHLISDKGSQFWQSGYKRWCSQNNIQPRFGAIGRHGSIAVLERALRTIKDGLRLSTVSTRQGAMRGKMEVFVEWYNQHRPHTTLNGQTPDEVHFKRFPASRRPRIEPRPAWPRGAPCASPHVLVAGKPGARLEVEVEHFHGHAHLPIIRLRRAA
jgi:putative transposase